jgi:hypothetical protein
MNERIKELALQAGEYTNSVYKPPVRDITLGNGKIWKDGHVGWHEIFNQKFAELIVRECANRATWAQDTDAKDIGGEILKHFGVE